MRMHTYMQVVHTYSHAPLKQSCDECTFKYDMSVPPRKCSVEELEVQFYAICTISTGRKSQEIAALKAS